VIAEKTASALFVIAALIDESDCIYLQCPQLSYRM